MKSTQILSTILAKKMKMRIYLLPFLLTVNCFRVPHYREDEFLTSLDSLEQTIEDILGDGVVKKTADVTCVASSDKCLTWKLDGFSLVSPGDGGAPANSQSGNDFYFGGGKMTSSKEVSTPGACFSFHYFLIGLAEVKVFYVADDGRKVELYSDEEKSDLWKHSQVNINSDEAYTLVIEGITYGTSKVAIDGLEFKTSSCPIPTKVWARRGCYWQGSTFSDMTSFRAKIDWTDMQTSVVEPCRQHVISRGFKKYGIAFYGECWYNKTHAYAGKSSSCYNGQTGVHQTQMVYEETTTGF